MLQCLWLLLLRRWEKTAAVKLCNHTCLGDDQDGDANDDDNDDDLHKIVCLAAASKMARWEKKAAVKPCNHSCLDGQDGDST